LKIRFKSEIGAIQLSRAHFLLPSGRPTNKRPASIDLPCTTGRRPSPCPPLSRLCRPSHQSDPPPFFLLRGRPSPPPSPFIFSLLRQEAAECSPRLLSPSCLPSDSERPAASPLPRLAIPMHRRLPTIVRLHRIAATLPCSGGNHLHTHPLLSLDFVSWLTSSSRCCRSCPRSSMAVVRAHLWQEAPTPPNSIASPPPAPSVSARPILLAWLPARTTMVLVVKT
jgi:hypothetical protein